MDDTAGTLRVRTKYLAKPFSIFLTQLCLSSFNGTMVFARPALLPLCPAYYAYICRSFYARMHIHIYFTVSQRFLFPIYVFLSFVLFLCFFFFRFIYPSPIFPNPHNP